MEPVDHNGIPLSILREAKKDPLIGPRVILRSTRREPLCCGGRVVGFVTPHESPWGSRVGPVFILEGFRSRGLLVSYYAAHPDKAFVAFIPSGRGNSKRAHECAGFVPWRKAKGGEWMRRDALEAGHERIG